MSFLDKIWESLESKKQKQQNPNCQFITLHQGFRTIHIQQLEPKPFKKFAKIKGKDLWSYNKKIVKYEENAPLTQRAENGFFTCLFQAYINHGDLMIKPDDIWLTIMLWFSSYMGNHAEQLRKAFVSHEGKKKLIVIMGSIDFIQWDYFFEKIIEEIRLNTNKGVTEKLECNFTSTGLFQRLFSSAIIMDCFKYYFQYEGMAGCGIQNVHMGGTLDDWEKVKIKLENMKQFDVDGQLKSYINGLLPVIQQFIQTYKGYPHLQFWNNILHQRQNPSEYAYQLSHILNGWLIKFFTTDDQLADQIFRQQIQVDIKFKNVLTKQEKDFKLLGGCQGYSITQNHIYRPHFALAIAQIPKVKPPLLKKQKRPLTKQTIRVNKVIFGTNKKEKDSEQLKFKEVNLIVRK